MLLKNKFALILTICAVGATLFTAVVLSFFAVDDQESFLQELQSNQTAASEKLLRGRMELLYHQVQQVIPTSQKTLEVLVAALPGCLAAETWQGETPIAIVKLPVAVTRLIPGKSRWALVESPLISKSAIRWVARYSDFSVALDFDKSWFDGVLSATHGGKSELVLPDGKVLIHAGSQERIYGNELFGSREALNRAFQFRQGFSQTRRYQTEDGKNYLGTFLKMSLEPPIMIVQSTSWLVSEIILRMTVIRSAWIAALFLLLSFIVALAFASSLAVPLQVLGSKIREVAAGNFDSQVDVPAGRKDEVWMLALSFNGMIRELQHTREELKRTERLAALGTFSAAIAHEIKNPLGGILANTQLVQRLVSRDPLEREDIEETLKMVEEETLRANRIITQLMKFSRKDTPPSSIVNMTDRIGRSIAFVRPQVEAEGIKFINSVPKEAILCVANGDQIHEVFLNLVQNAMHAVRERSKKEIRIRISTTIAMLTLFVEDSGVGMSQETKQHLFEPFFTTKKVGEGTGLGLAVCHGIVSNHRGRIEVDSREGEGTSIRVYIPMVHGDSEVGKKVA